VVVRCGDGIWLSVIGGWSVRIDDFLESGEISISLSVNKTGRIVLMQQEKKPKVSVCVLTYNHEKYIRQCLQSIIDQETDFDFEVVVGDDCSTDGTRAIVREFAEKYPGVVKPIFHEINVGSNPNYFSVHGSAIGKYVAHIDGDDYALPGKLQKQADKLDQELGINILWHRMELVNDNGLRRAHPDLKAPYLNVNISRADLMLYGPFGQHSSTMYRKENFSLRYADFQVIDWILSVELIGDGSGFMLQDLLGAYRVHSEGMTGGAVANSKVRGLVCDCQLDLMKRFPAYKSLVALRAFFTTALDFISFRKYFIKSLNVLIQAKTIPKLSAALKLLKFCRFSKLPAEFKLVHKKEYE
jgi:glycosyltransferase involved in cell wall biosynthesis